jgi:hypothetical protein
VINMAVNRSLSKRVQKLEARLIPTEERRAIHVVYVSPDGTRKDGYTVWGPSGDPSAQPPYKRPSG